MTEAIYAAAYVAEFERLVAKGITPNYEDKNGWPYQGVTGREAWLDWCSHLAHHYAEGMVYRHQVAQPLAVKDLRRTERAAEDELARRKKAAES